MEDALAVHYEEGKKLGIALSRSPKEVEIVRNALVEGISSDVIQEITGLDKETIGIIHGYYFCDIAMKQSLRKGKDATALNETVGFIMLQENRRFLV